MPIAFLITSNTSVIKPKYDGLMSIGGERLGGQKHDEPKPSGWLPQVVGKPTPGFQFIPPKNPDERPLWLGTIPSGLAPSTWTKPWFWDKGTEAGTGGVKRFAFVKWCCCPKDDKKMWQNQLDYGPKTEAKKNFMKTALLLPLLYLFGSFDTACSSPPPGPEQKVPPPKVAPKAGRVERLSFIDKNYVLLLQSSQLSKGPINWEKELDAPQLSPKKAYEKALAYTEKFFGNFNWGVTEISIVNVEHNSPGLWVYRVNFEILCEGLRPSVAIYVDFSGNVIPWTEAKD